MNKDNAKDYLPLVQALADGKTIQLKVESLENPEGVWKDWENPKFDREVSAYRIKPEPMEFEIWINRDGSTVYHTSQNGSDEYHGDSRKIRVREILD